MAPPPRPLPARPARLRRRTVRSARVRPASRLTGLGGLEAFACPAETSPRQLDDAGRRGGPSDDGGARMAQREQLDRGLRIVGRDYAAEPAAHVEDLVQLGGR